ncbi:MAG: prevent-host-death family protein [Acidimicrobiales bacterium]|jgi:prevent-host-death family protein
MDTDHVNTDQLNVGIRELKAKLSEYVASVSEGARVTVTDRGRPVAELVPISGPSQLARGIEAGWVDPPRRTTLGEPLLFESRRSIAAVLDDDRGV